MTNKTDYPSELLAEITKRIRKASDPDQIILFGSFGRGDSRPGSDLDILVVKERVESTRSEASKIYQALADIPIPVDIVVVRKAYLETYRDIVGTILYSALQEGETLYAQ
jgi:predicted nucleotidyltransferase